MTFFREALHLTPQQAAGSDATWRPDQIYLAHLALSDIDGGRFFHTERWNRAGPGLAGSSLGEQRYWNGNWQVHWTSLATGKQELTAVCDEFSIKLDLNPEKPFVIHGQNGISRKGPLPAQASHYISYTRLGASGNIDSKSKSFAVSGLAWMDHEFFTEPRDENLAGWDWFAIQLDNNEELMLYRLRLKSGAPDPYSSGTYVDSGNRAHFLAASDIEFSPSAIWQSPASGARYPLAWTVAVPSLGLDLNEKTALKNQELFSARGVSPAYWEGAVTYDGHIRAQTVKGVGYLEMTGYASGPLLPVE